MKIGFFDSGIGGLTVLYQALKQLPDHDYLYYADTVHAPYGPKPKSEVRGYVLAAVEFLIEAGAEIVVIACNTATSIAVNELREKYDIPIIGMEPAVKPAIERNEALNKRVLVTATPLTLVEEKLKNLIESLDNEGIVDLLPLPDLVRFAEKFDFTEETVVPYLQTSLKGLDIPEYSTVVLGCTHFPLFKQSFRAIFGENVDLIDGSIGTVNHLQCLIVTSEGSPKGSGHITFFRSGELVSNQEEIEDFRKILAKMDTL
ncbi:MAG TPA: glutamate racemase [Firmicutes bacterium]|nr:glutamate racemase [Bacillota bacterium]